MSTVVAEKAAVGKPVNAVAKQRIEPLDDPLNARTLVKAAIAAANYANAGAKFSPFAMKFAAPTDFTWIWSSQRGQTPMTFYVYAGNRTDGFLPLGDIGLPNYGSLADTPLMLLGLTDDDRSALAHPTGFTQLLTDHGSGNPQDFAYWAPIAPAGYQALGICLSNNYNAPPPTANYWCVSEQYLQDAGVQLYWSDSGTHIEANSSLNRPVITGLQSGDNLLLTPTTILSVQANSPAYCLVTSKLFLNVPGASVPQPSYSDAAGYGSATHRGIVNVAVLPVTCITDTNLGASPKNSPFYYLAGEAYWQCTGGFPSAQGGTYETDYTVGVSQSASQAFQLTNSVTVGANVGIEAGDKGGFAGQIAVSYTHDMQVTKSFDAGRQTEYSTKLSLTLPQSPRILVWQRCLELVTYRTNGTPLSDATYETPEVTFTAKP